MGQQNSKIDREKDEYDKEHAKKVRFKMQKLNDKNEGKENQDGFSKDEKIRLENEQYRASEETKQTEKGGEIRNPSSVDSTELQTGNRSNRKENMDSDSDSDEATDKGVISLERTDDGEYTNLHNYPLNKTNCNCSAVAQSLRFDNHEQEFTEDNLLGKGRCRKEGKKDTNNDLNMNVNKKAEEEVLNKCGHTQEQDLNPEFIDIQVHCMTIYFTFERNAIFHRDMEQMNQDSSGQKRSKVDSKNSEIFVKGENGNATDTAEEKLKRVNNIETRKYVKIDKTMNTTSSKLSMTLYDTHIFPFKHYKNHFTFNPVRSNNDRPLNVHVYAIGFKGGSMLMGVYEDKNIIKYILQTPTWRERYLEDEHFRFATFSLSVFNYEMGEIIRLAGTGFFCDADGGVKCYCCGNTYTGEHLSSHHPDCASQTSDEHVGRSIADHYGESAPDTLVPSGQNVQECRTEAFDIRIQTSAFSYRLGRTQEIFQDDSLVPEEEINENENVLSVREGSMQPSQETEYYANTFSVIEGPMHSRQETLQSSNELSMRESPMPSRHGTPDSAIEFSVREGPLYSTQETPRGTNIEEPVSGSRVNNLGVFHGNQGRCVTSHGHEVEGSLGQGSVGVPLNSERRTGQSGESSNDQLLFKHTERHMLTTGRRTIKEDVNRGSPAKTARLDAENTHMRRRTLCCKCKVRRCNVVFIPCGHLVICNVCVSNTTVCPVCKTKVNEAIEVDDQFR